MAPVIAACETSDPTVIGYLVPLAGAALFVGIVVAAFRACPPGLRMRLAALLVASAAIGAIIVNTPGGLDADGDYLARAVTAAVVGTVGGLLVAVNHRQHALSFAVVGGLGGVAFIALVFALLVAAFWGGGACIG